MARYIQLHRKDIEEIARNYYLDVIDFESIDEGDSNSSYLLHTQQGPYVLTIFDDKTLTEVVGIGLLLLLLAEHKFPATRLLPPARGGIATMYMNKPLIVKVYIPGQVYKGLDETMLYQVGESLAQLHQITAPCFLPNTHAYGLQVFSRAISQNIDKNYETWLAKRATYLEQYIPPTLPSGLIHGDLFCTNLVFEEKKFKAIIDFEEACYYYKVFDLGMGIVGLCLENSLVRLDKTRMLVKGYQRVRALEPQEKSSLLLFVEYAAIATSYWRFWKYNIHTPLAKKADKHWQMVEVAENVASISKTMFEDVVFD